MLSLNWVFFTQEEPRPQRPGPEKTPLSGSRAVCPGESPLLSFSTHPVYKSQPCWKFHLVALGYQPYFISVSKPQGPGAGGGADLGTETLGLSSPLGGGGYATCLCSHACMHTRARLPLWCAELVTRVLAGLARGLCSCSLGSAHTEQDLEPQLHPLGAGPVADA